MNELEPLIPGIYVDRDERIRLNMREFMSVHGIRDSLKSRAIVWEEMREIFGGMEVIEISDWELLHLSTIFTKPS